jgi:hypothetical protein
MEKKYIEASEYLSKALSLSKEIGGLVSIRDSYDYLTSLDSSQGNFNKAWEHYKLYITSHSLRTMRILRRQWLCKMN